MVPNHYFFSMFKINLIFNDTDQFRKLRLFSMIFNKINYFDEK